MEQLAIRPLRFVMVGQSQLDQLQPVHLSVSSPANSTRQSGQSPDSRASETPLPHRAVTVRNSGFETLFACPCQGLRLKNLHPLIGHEFLDAERAFLGRCPACRTNGLLAAGMSTYGHVSNRVTGDDSFFGCASFAVDPIVAKSCVLRFILGITEPKQAECLISKNAVPVVGFRPADAL